EWVHVQLHQQKGMISLSPPTICNSASFSVLIAQIQQLQGVLQPPSTEKIITSLPVNTVKKASQKKH
ncbi:hypothetical protein ACV2JJ_24315, partial [Salmonella enterica subsp. enterica serovar 1,4,[5],12:i:-]